MDADAVRENFFIELETRKYKAELLRAERIRMFLQLLELTWTPQNKIAQVLQDLYVLDQPRRNQLRPFDPKDLSVSELCRFNQEAFRAILKVLEEDELSSQKRKRDNDNGHDMLKLLTYRGVYFVYDEYMSSRYDSRKEGAEVYRDFK